MNGTLKTLANASQIVAVVIGGYFATEVVFVTQSKFAHYALKDIERDIDSFEQTREKYAMKSETERGLDFAEKRHAEKIERKLERLYAELETARERVNHYER